MEVHNDGGWDVLLGRTRRGGATVGPAYPRGRAAWHAVLQTGQPFHAVDGRYPSRGSHGGPQRRRLVLRRVYPAEGGIPPHVLAQQHPPAVRRAGRLHIGDAVDRAAPRTACWSAIRDVVSAGRRGVGPVSTSGHVRCPHAELLPVHHHGSEHWTSG